MLTFKQFIQENSGLTTGAAVAIAAKIRSIHQQVTQDRTATRSEKAISQEVAWLAALTALGVYTGGASK